MLRIAVGVGILGRRRLDIHGGQFFGSNMDVSEVWLPMVSFAAVVVHTSHIDVAGLYSSVLVQIYLLDVVVPL